MKEYIEREKIWPALNAACVPYNRATQKAIESIPAANVQSVIFCKDCAVPHNKWTGCPKLGGLVTESDFFCAFGEPKGDSE